MSINLYSSDNAIYSFYLFLTLFVPIFQLLPHTILLKTKRDTLQRYFIVRREWIGNRSIQKYHQKWTRSYLGLLKSSSYIQILCDIWKHFYIIIDSLMSLEQDDFYSVSKLYKKRQSTRRKLSCLSSSKPITNMYKPY